jgi:hypothetical protein
MVAGDGRFGVLVLSLFFCNAKDLRSIHCNGEFEFKGFGHVHS